MSEQFEAALQELFRAITARDRRLALQLILATPGLSTAATRIGATREGPRAYFFPAISHYAYAGDTALHLAAAAYLPEVARELLDRGALVRAKNRRGAEPLHYAADGIPGSEAWNPEAQAAVVALLLDAGAHPDALDKSGVSPLHRAVRTRSASAVRALLERGANPSLENKSASTPLQLALQNTGRGGSGGPEAREQQAIIIGLLQAATDGATAH